jgi:hypothetical protein
MASPTALANPVDEYVGSQRWSTFSPSTQLTLSERTGGDLDTVGNTELGVTRGDRVELTEL